MAYEIATTQPVSSGPIHLQQTLHGYADGHRLLSTSVTLSEKASRLMLTLSDLSGTATSRGFDAYVTGYPLPDFDAYAFARTWCASEMPRPGCVWTHTLLIRNQDLSTINSLAVLLPLFRRPVDGVPPGYDEQQVYPSFDLQDNQPGQDIAVDPNLEFISAFYSEPESPVVINALRIADEELLVLDAWSQLWPAARQRLTFSTSSLSARKYEGRAFDIQVAAPAVAREIARSFQARMVSAERSSQATSRPPEDWAAILTNLRRSGAAPSFQSFLANATDDWFRRTEMPRLIQIFNELQRMDNSREAYVDLLQFVAKLYPEPQSAERLKQWCLSAGPNGTGFDSWLFQEIASGPFASAFGSPALGLSERARNLFESAPNIGGELLSQLLERELNAFGEQIAKGFITSWGEEDTLRFLRNQPRFLPTFVRLRPLLVEDSRFWESFRLRAGEILDLVVSSASWDGPAVKRILDAMVEASADFDTQIFVDRFGALAVAAIFGRFGNAAGSERNRWLEAVCSRQNLVLEFASRCGTLQPDVIGGIARTLSPQSIEPDRFPIQKWAEAMTAEAVGSLTNPSPALEVAAFTFGIAIKKGRSIPEKHGIASFKAVHQAAALEALPDRAWSMLDPYLPRLAAWKYWDKCERLRRALIQIFVRDRWSILTLLNEMPDKEFFECLVEGAKQIDEGAEFIRLVGETLRASFPTENPYRSEIQKLEKKSEGRARRR